ncbi:MAG TPA: hypothetical protein VII30_06700 [Gemmatimonadaceae bacterium]
MRVLSALFLFIAAPFGAQMHCDVHYRWQEKIDATHLTVTPTATTLSQMLGWSSPAFTAAETYWCQARNTREQTVYQLTAWARRLKVQSGATGDGDWHIELTSLKTSPVTSCIVIEIPPDTLSPAYFQARQDFLATITDGGSIIKSTGDVAPPVRVKVKGLAFFDGEHRGASTKPAWRWVSVTQSTARIDSRPNLDRMQKPRSRTYPQAGQ